MLFPPCGWEGKRPPQLVPIFRARLGPKNWNCPSGKLWMECSLAINHNQNLTWQGRGEGPLLLVLHSHFPWEGAGACVAGPACGGGRRRARALGGFLWASVSLLLR